MAPPKTTLPQLLLFLAAILAAMPSATEPIAERLEVTVIEGRLDVKAGNQSVKSILQRITREAGIQLSGEDLLPEDRVTVLIEGKPLRRELPELFTLAPKLNYVLVYSEEEAGRIVRVSLFPREGTTGVVTISGGSSRAGSSSRQSYRPPPPPPPLPRTNPNAPPRYVPPATPPVYIPPESPPVYIPPESPPQYIPADGPPVYIPPAPPPGKP